MGFSRQEYWSGSPFPSPGDLPNPGVEPRSPALQADSLPAEQPGKPHFIYIYIYIFFFFNGILNFRLKKISCLLCAVCSVQRGDWLEMVPRNQRAFGKQGPVLPPAPLLTLLLWELVNLLSVPPAVRTMMRGLPPTAHHPQCSPCPPPGGSDPTEQFISNL